MLHVPTALLFHSCFTVVEHNHISTLFGDGCIFVTFCVVYRFYVTELTGAVNGRMSVASLRIKKQINK